MNWTRLREQLLVHHSSHMQNSARIELALKAVEDGLSELAQLGHPFHLEEGPGKELEEWPKMMYHMRGSPEGRLVRSPEDLEELGPGWYNSWADAQKARGFKSQFNGRGGVKTAGLPATIAPGLRSG